MPSQSPIELTTPKDSFAPLRRQLLKWYQLNRRKLPWRNTRDPYRIWISEIMLQQTQVATVVDYFRRFLTQFPTIQVLADAEEQQVLSAWAGLGYYRRARQLHAAAKQICQNHQGQFPAEFNQILDLPGIGRYTAGAIASIAHDDRRPILEANTIRLFSRVEGLTSDPTTADSQKRLWTFAEAVLPPRRGAGEINQAVMELGSLVCTPKNPTCLECPIVQHCQAHQTGRQHHIPLVKRKPKPTQLKHVLVVIRRGNRLLVRQNEPGNWWEGLWDFPRTEVDKNAFQSPKSRRSQVVSPASQSIAEATLLESLGLPCTIDGWIRSLRHGVTRYRIELDCFEAELLPGVSLGQLPGKWKWLSPDGRVELPLTSTAMKLLEWLTKNRT